MVNQGNIQADVDPNQAAHAMSHAAEKGKEHMAQASEKAEEIGDAASEKTKQGMKVSGDKMTSLAGSIRESAPSRGRMRKAANKVADSLESSGQYLKGHGLGDIADDMAELIRKYPMQSLFVGLGAGVVLGSAIFRKD